MKGAVANGNTVTAVRTLTSCNSGDDVAQWLLGEGTRDGGDVLFAHAGISVGIVPVRRQWRKLQRRGNVRSKCAFANEPDES